MTVPPLYDDVVSCFCGHGPFDHDNYGPCSGAMPSGRPCNCRAFHGCLVIGGPPPAARQPTDP